MESTLVIKNSYTYCKNLLVIETKYYMHATGIKNFNTSISQIHNYSTSMTLISPSPYLKTIVKYQTSHSIQHTHKRILLFLNTWHIRILSKLPCYLRLSK